MGQTLWAVGAVINVMGSIFINLGTNVMKLGHNKRDLSPLPDADRPPIRKFKEWQLGIALFAVGNVLNFISFGFAAQSLLAALGSVQFISNVVFAHFVLHERVTKKILGGTGLIVLGCILLVSFGNHTSEILTVHDMIEDFKSTPYIVYLVLLVLCIGGMYTTYRIGKRRLRLVGHDGLSGWWVRMLPISYALFSGMLGTQSVLFCKMLSMLLRTTIQGDSQLASWFTWLIFFLFLGTAFFWVSRLNKALKQFPAIFIVPTMQISWTLFSIMGGGVYFQEYKTFTVLSASMFALGVAVVFIGVFMLTPSKRAYLRHYKDIEDKRSMLHPNLDGGGPVMMDVEARLPVPDPELGKLEDPNSFNARNGKDQPRGSSGDMDQGVTKRGLGSRRSAEQDSNLRLDPQKLPALRVMPPPTHSGETKRTTLTGDRWDDVVISPLSSKDDGNPPLPAGAPPPAPDAVLLDLTPTLLEDIKDDFSVDVSDNYRRLLGLESKGQLAAVSVLGMPFDCFLDRADDFGEESSSGTAAHNGAPRRGPSDGHARRAGKNHPVSRGQPGSHSLGPARTVLATGPGPPAAGSSSHMPGHMGDHMPGHMGAQGGRLALDVDGMKETEFSPRGAGSGAGEGVHLDSWQAPQRDGVSSTLSSPWMSPRSVTGLSSPPETSAGVTTATAPLATTRRHSAGLG